mmetsp:Transcript_13036/g.48378  ORF Transcript_13036/g.48378 Transcript_13036/m.48378 type:complete len:294 (+) Transcript_13036:82-963(+)
MHMAYPVKSCNLRDRPYSSSISSSSSRLVRAFACDSAAARRSRISAKSLTSTSSGKSCSTSVKVRTAPASSLCCSESGTHSASEVAGDLPSSARFSVPPSVASLDVLIFGYGRPKTRRWTRILASCRKVKAAMRNSEVMEIPVVSLAAPLDCSDAGAASPSVSAASLPRSFSGSISSTAVLFWSSPAFKSVWICNSSRFSAVLGADAASAFLFASSAASSATESSGFEALSGACSLGLSAAGSLTSVGEGKANMPFRTPICGSYSSMIMFNLATELAGMPLDELALGGAVADE